MKVKVKSLSRVWLLATPWTAAYQAPPSMGFSGQQYWSGVPSPSPWSDPKRWFSGGCYRMRPQGGSTASCPRRFPLATGVLENSRVPGLEIRVRNARAPVSLLLPLLPAPARQVPSSAETVMLRVLFYFDGGTFQSSFRLLCPKSFKYSRLAQAVGGPAWIWGLGSYPQGTRHSTSKEGSFAGTSSTAPSVQPPSSPSLGPHAAQAPGMWPQPRSSRPRGECHGHFFSVVFSLKLFFTVYSNRLIYNVVFVLLVEKCVSVTWIHVCICIFQFLSHLGYYRVLSRVPVLGHCGLSILHMLLCIC